MRISQATLHGFADELEKIAIDPVELGGMLGMGKIMTTNALSRYGHHLPPLRRVAQEVAGVGARTAMQGKPMLSRPLRAAAAIGIDPKMVGLYENAHGAASALKANAGLSPSTAPGAVRSLTQDLRGLAQSKGMASMAGAAKFVDGIPLEHGPGALGAARKAVDYGFTPVRQVGRDVGGLAQRGAQAVTGGVQRAVGAVGGLARRMIPTR